MCPEGGQHYREQDKPYGAYKPLVLVQRKPRIRLQFDLVRGHMPYHGMILFTCRVAGTGVEHPDRAVDVCRNGTVMKHLKTTAKREILNPQPLEAVATTTTITSS
jgi:hypothetical protein